MNTFEFVRCLKKVCSMSNLVDLVKALLGSKFDVRSFEAKNRVFEFDHQQMNTFEFIHCSKNDVQVRSMFDKMVFDPSLLLFTFWQYLQVVDRSQTPSSKHIELKITRERVTSKEQFEVGLRGKMTGIRL